MDEKIEELVLKANQNKSYQILLIVLGLFIYITTNVISSTYGFFSIEPMVNITINNKTESIHLNYSICQKYPNYKIVDEYENTWYSDYGNQCSQFVTWMMNFLGNFGSLAGFLTVPYAIKCFGEKNTILYTGYSYSIVTFINVLMPMISGALIFDFLNNFTGTMMEISFFMSLAENCPGKMRSIALNIIGSGYSLAGVIFVLLFKSLNSWKIPFIISSILNFVLTIAIHIFMFQSPRYYLKIGKVDKFIKTLKEIARFNRCHHEFDPIANKILSDYNSHGVDIEEENQSDNSLDRSLLIKFKEYQENIERERLKYSILDVLRFKSHRYKFLLMCLICFIGMGVYQSYAINIKNFPGDVFINGIIVNSVQLIFAVSSGVLMNVNFLKRKGLMMISIFINIVIFALIIFIDFDKITKRVFECIIIVCAYIFMTVLGVYNTEIYSSKLLNIALPWNSIFSTIGAMLFPSLVEYLEGRTLDLIFGSLYIVCILVLVYLPETYRKPQPNEIPEEKLIEDVGV